jgi:phage FluMu protein Com
MYSTKCPHCKQLINLKTEEVREAVSKAEAEKQSHYEMNCPKCGKYIKLQIKELKRKLPRVSIDEAMSANKKPDQETS